MPHRDYVDDPVILWPPEDVTKRQHLCNDTPSTGVTCDQMGLWTFLGNYHGTGLIVVDASPELNWHVNQPGFLFCAGVREDGPAHHDLRRLCKVVHDVWMDEMFHDTPPPRAKALDVLLDTSVDFLVKRGWVEMMGIHWNPGDPFWSRRQYPKAQYPTYRGLMGE